MKEIKIETPNDLVKAFKLVRKELDEGKIKLTFEHKSQDRFEIPQFDFIKKFDWPDYFSNYYEEAATGKIYRLYAETYHGSGGALIEVQDFED